MEDASSVQQAGSGGEETEGNVSSEIEETTDSASTSSQSGSVSEEDEEPEGSVCRGMEETTGALNAMSLAETEEASASTSSQNDQVLLSKFQRKFYVFGIKLRHVYTCHDSLFYRENHLISRIFISDSK